VANDKLTIGERSVRLPLIGRVAMKESMRFAGTVKGASVSRHGTSWFLAVQVDLDVCWLIKVDRSKPTDSSRAQSGALAAVRLTGPRR
jgi:hypothetical protein